MYMCALCNIRLGGLEIQSVPAYDCTVENAYPSAGATIVSNEKERKKIEFSKSMRNKM